MVGSTRSEFRLNGAIGDKKLVTNCANGFVGSQKTTPKKIFLGTGGGLGWVRGGRLNPKPKFLTSGGLKRELLGS